MTEQELKDLERTTERLQQLRKRIRDYKHFIKFMETYSCNVEIIAKPINSLGICHFSMGVKTFDGVLKVILKDLEESQKEFDEIQLVNPILNEQPETKEPPESPGHGSKGLHNLRGTIQHLFRKKDKD